MRRQVVTVILMGVFLLLVTVVSLAQGGPIILTVDEPYKFSLQSGAMFDDLLLFQFTAPEQPVAISLRTSDPAIEPLVLAFDSDGNEIAQPYEVDEMSFILPMLYTGDIFLRAGRQDWIDQGGEMTLLVQTVSEQVITPGQPVNSTLATGNHLDFYTFDATAGQLISYGATCDECGLILFQPDDEIFDEEGTYEDPGNYLLRLPLDGTYTMMIGTSRPDMAYSASITTVEPQPLLSGEAMSATVGMQPVYFSFESPAGKAWEITTDLPNSGNRELRVLYLDDGRAPWEAVVAFDQGSGPDGNARIAPFVAPQDGVYYVLAFYYDYSDMDTPTEGTITLGPASLLSLAPGMELQGSVTPDSGPATYLYQGKAGEVITLAITRLTGDAGIALDIFGPSDEVARMGGLNAISFESMLILPEDGIYRINISAVTYEQPDITFSLIVASQ
ncbi:MAG: pre-peptidase C-terminal domain-containing protein [Anaerolineae bacterium]|nr:pre-peptidase C-terminal domain-containing protein [Anaerolineae bacterium]